VRPFDPRLARDLKPVRGTIGFTAVLHFLAAVLLVIQSLVAAAAITQSFIWEWDLNRTLPLILIAAGAWAARVILVSVNESVARKFGLKSVAVVRENTLRQLLKTPASRLPLGAGEISTLLTRGIEGIEVYVSKYLPQLVISVIVPLGMGLVILWLDPLSALILAITIPLIPLFMILVGWFTNDQVELHWQRVLAVAGTLADLLNGLPELKVFGRARAQGERIRELSNNQRIATMKVLRLSFLSAMVLELLATISVALIAVGIGLRLVNGEMELWRGLAALVLAPEVYAPLRMLGVHFHAAADGLEAWSRVKQLLDAKPLESGSKILPASSLKLEWTELQVEIGNQVLTLPAGSVSNELLSVAGPSGCGKSTLIECLLGMRDVQNGEIQVSAAGESIAVADLSISEYHARIGYVGQDAWLGAGTTREVVTRNAGRPVADNEIEEVFANLRLDIDLDKPISDRSQGVSIGQRRRLAVARALLRRPDLLILDEPAAALDVETEVAVVHALKQYASVGHTVLVVAHRESFIAAADKVLDFKQVRV
jgi:ATP-binding cassette subfamily C protein CydCD